MGRNRKWVLEDNLSEAVWRTILRGPRPPSVTWGSNKSSASVLGKQPHNPVPKKGKGKGQSKDAGPPVQSPAVPKPNLNPDEQLKAAQTRVVKLEAAIMAIGDEDPAVAGLKEALAKARAQAQLRPVQDRIAHTEAFLDRSRKKMEALSAEVQNPRSHGGVDNQNPERNKSVGGFEGGSQGAADSPCQQTLKRRFVCCEHGSHRWKVPWTATCRRRRE